jgi:hypothetical protein
MILWLLGGFQICRAEYTSNSVPGPTWESAAAKEFANLIFVFILFSGSPVINLAKFSCSSKLQQGVTFASFSQIPSAPLVEEHC